MKSRVEHWTGKNLTWWTSPSTELYMVNKPSRLQFLSLHTQMYIAQTNGLTIKLAKECLIEENLADARVSGPLGSLSPTERGLILTRNTWSRLVNRNYFGSWISQPSRQRGASGTYSKLRAACKHAFTISSFHYQKNREFLIDWILENISFNSLYYKQFIVREEKEQNSTPYLWRSDINPNSHDTYQILHFIRKRRAGGYVCYLDL
jgi:hypothetical protein